MIQRCRLACNHADYDDVFCVQSGNLILGCFDLLQKLRKSYTFMRFAGKRPLQERMRQDACRQMELCERVVQARITLRVNCCFVAGRPPSTEGLSRVPDIGVPLDLPARDGEPMLLPPRFGNVELRGKGLDCGSCPSCDRNTSSLEKILP